MYIGSPSDVLVKLTSSGAPKLGVVDTDLIIKVWEQGAPDTIPYVPAAANWVELGDGLYILKLPGALISVLGLLHLYISGTIFDAAAISLDITAPPISVSANPDVCTITGNLLNLSSRSGSGQVSFRTVHLPKKVGVTLINADRIIMYPDAAGNFSVSLIRGATVWVEIPSAGINNQITVPNQPTALLTNLLPPIS